ncbi:MAG: hypothetical protein J6A37_13610, partial [Oscillospiraceae bacterium]|nr:hypothetical protein [Oscillospiraceae bacterium]
GQGIEIVGFNAVAVVPEVLIVDIISCYGKFAEAVRAPFPQSLLVLYPACVNTSCLYFWQ